MERPEIVVAHPRELQPHHLALGGVDGEHRVGRHDELELVGDEERALIPGRGVDVQLGGVLGIPRLEPRDQRVRIEVEVGEGFAAHPEDLHPLGVTQELEVVDLHHLGEIAQERLHGAGLVADLRGEGVVVLLDRVG